MAPIDTYKQPVPRHLLYPPGKYKQCREYANVFPRYMLIKPLIPGTFGEDIIPPRLEFGCIIEDERMVEIAEKLGCITPEERNFDRFRISNRVANGLRYKLGGLDMKMEIVFNGNLSEGGDEEYSAIYSFGSSHELDKFPSNESLIKVLGILEMKPKDFKWWVSQEVWYWRCIDLKKEARRRQIDELLLEREWEIVLARIEAQDARRRQHEEGNGRSLEA